MKYIQDHSGNILYRIDEFIPEPTDECPELEYEISKVYLTPGLVWLEGIKTPFGQSIQ